MLVVRLDIVTSYIGNWLFWSEEIMAERCIKSDWYWIEEWEHYVCYGGWWNGTLLEPLV